MPPSPYLDLSTVINALRGSLGGWGARGFLGQALMFLLYRRLFVIRVKMERLIERFQAGRLWRRAPRVALSPAVSPVADAALCGGTGSVWPCRFGWLVRLASYQAAGYGSQLRAVLQTPEMVALLVAAPQAVEILRPLCRMLAVETALLRPYAKASVKVVACTADAGEDGREEGDVVVRRQSRGRPVAVDWGRIPLPRGVLAAARRQGVRKGG